MRRLIYPILFCCALLLTQIVLAGPASPYAQSPFADNQEKINSLFDELKSAESFDEALKIEFDLLDIWTRSSDIERARELMWLGIISLEQEELHNALLMFDGAIKHDPEWAEAWNKRAAVNFFLGNYEASLHDVKQALQREPRHFGALTGLGHLQAKSGRFENSIKTYRKALSIHPFMTDAKHMLKALMDMQREKPYLFMEDPESNSPDT